MLIRAKLAMHAAAVGAAVVAGLSPDVHGDDTRRQRPAPIVKPEALLPWIIKAETGRADLVAIGDSNQAFQTTGWDHGVSRAMELRFGLYATGLLSLGENTGQGLGLGYGYQVHSTASTGQFVYTGAPVELETFMTTTLGMHPLRYLRVPIGSQAGGWINQGMYMLGSSSLDTSAALRFSVTYGVIPGTHPGVFKPSVRIGQSPFATLIEGDIVQTSGSAYSAATATLDLPREERPFNLDFRLSPWGWNVVGPFVGYYVRVENAERERGVSAHTLYALGGDSARDIAARMQGVSDAQLALYFERVRAAQHPPVRVLVRINCGLNDRLETLPSVGPIGGLDSRTGPGYADNLRAIINRVQQVWQASGWSADELFFLLSVSHVVASPDDPLLIAFRQAAAEIAQGSPNIAATNFEGITSYGEMLSRGWYELGGFDINHLTQSGFEQLATRELRAIEAGKCWRDLNRDGAIGVEDLYEANAAPSDLDMDGVASSADIRCLAATIRAGEASDVIHGGEP